MTFRKALIYHSNSSSILFISDNFISITSYVFIKDLWREILCTYPIVKAPIEIKCFDADNKLPHGYWPNNTHSLAYSFCGTGVRIRQNWVACIGYQWSSNKVSAAMHLHVEAWVGEESMFKVIQVVGRIYFPCSCKTEHLGFF